MRGNIRIWGVSLLLLTVALVAVGCEKREPVTSSTVSNTGGGGSTAVRTAEAEVTSVKGPMEAKGGSNVTGTAELVAGTPGTKVTVTVKGLQGSQYVAYIYHGSCDGAGERHGPLSAFQPDGDNSTSTTNFISLALNHFGGEPHFLVIHTGTSDNVGASVSCAELKSGS